MMCLKWDQENVVPVSAQRGCLVLPFFLLQAQTNVGCLSSQGRWKSLPHHRTQNWPLNLLNRGNMHHTESFTILPFKGFYAELEKAMATHSKTLAWKIPWTEGPGRLQSMGSRRVRHDWATSLFTFMHWRRKWQPTPVSLPGESQGRGSLVGCHRVGHTQLKQLSSSSSSSKQNK